MDLGLIIGGLSLHCLQVEKHLVASIKFKEFNILKSLPVDVLTNVHQAVISSVFFEMGKMDMLQFSLAFER